MTIILSVTLLSNHYNTSFYSSKSFTKRDFQKEEVNSIEIEAQEEAIVLNSEQKIISHSCFIRKLYYFDISKQLDLLLFALKSKGFFEKAIFVYVTTNAP